VDGKIKRIFDPRALRSQRVCLHIGFCTLRRRLDGTAKGERAAAAEFSFLISIFQAMAVAMCVDEEPAVSSPSCALMRFDAIDARQLLYGLVLMPIVSSWRGMRAKSFGSGPGGPAAVGRGSIRGPSRS